MSVVDDNFRIDFERQIEKYRPFSVSPSENEGIEFLVRSVISKAVGLGVNAAYGGERHDGGAQAMVNQLIGFLDGIRYVNASPLSGITPRTYLYAGALLTKDPEYQTYLRMKKKFEGDSND